MRHISCLGGADADRKVVNNGTVGLRMPLLDIGIECDAHDPRGATGLEPQPRVTVVRPPGGKFLSARSFGGGRQL